MSRITHNDINKIISSGKSFAIVRLPGEKELRVKSGVWKKVHLKKIDQPCFYVHPFDTSKKGFALMEGKEKVKSCKVESPVEISKEIYLHTFQNFHQKISKGSVSKLILSKVKRGSTKKINIGKSFFSLCANFPNACVNLFHIPGEGIWMGASPELLLAADNKETRSVSVAGTLSGGMKTFTTKEKKEQKIVTDYIRKVFSKTISVPMVTRQEILHAGNVQHLCNHFSVTSGFNKKTTLKLLERLHPTPAVGGFPKDKAVKFILKNELHHREMYAGYFGFIDPGRSCRFYVNIRCMKLVNNIPYIFTGGGITKDSIGLAEWIEAELKATGLINSLCIGEN